MIGRKFNVRWVDAGDLLTRARLHEFIVDEKAERLLVFAAIRCFKVNIKLRHLAVVTWVRSCVLSYLDAEEGCGSESSKYEGRQELHQSSDINY